MIILGKRNTYYPLDIFHRDGKLLTAEASDLKACGGFRLRRIYDDAVDEGIAIRNPNTGHTVRWYLDEVKRDGEGDIQHWHLLPIPEDVHQHPKLEGWGVTIFND